jgi:hypothetical protein
MASLKDQINDISDDSKGLMKDYIKLFSIRQSEKPAKCFSVPLTMVIEIIPEHHTRTHWIAVLLKPKEDVLKAIRSYSPENFPDHITDTHN